MANAHIFKRWFAIVGSRPEYDEDGNLTPLHQRTKEAVESFVDTLKADCAVVSGGANGPDRWAVQRAQARGLETKVFPAEWDKYGKSAGFRRNNLIVDQCHYLVAFWDGLSKGTDHTINLVLKTDKPFVVYVQNVLVTIREFEGEEPKILVARYEGHTSDPGSEED